MAAFQCFAEANTRAIGHFGPPVTASVWCRIITHQRSSCSRAGAQGCDYPWSALCAAYLQRSRSNTRCAQSVHLQRRHSPVRWRLACAVDPSTRARVSSRICASVANMTPPNAARAVVIALACAFVIAAPAVVLAAKTFTNQYSTKSGNEVFLKGHYIEVGMHSSGSFGTSGNPGGFNRNSNAPRTWNYGALLPACVLWWRYMVPGSCGAGVCIVGATRAIHEGAHVRANRGGCRWPVAVSQVLASSLTTTRTGTTLERQQSAHSRVVPHVHSLHPRRV